jgi:hypothetical protein
MCVCVCACVCVCVCVFVCVCVCVCVCVGGWVGGFVSLAHFLCKAAVGSMGHEQSMSCM